MAEEYDFFADLGETLTRTAKEFSTKADSFFESQKLRSQMMSEQKLIDKALADIGNIIYKKYVDGEAVDETITHLCEEVTERKITIAKFREEIARMNGEKVCAACGATVPTEAAFCMQCGAPCPKEEKTEEEVCEEACAKESQESEASEGEKTEETCGKTEE